MDTKNGGLQKVSFIYSSIWLCWISIVTFWREPQYPCSNTILTSIHLHLAYLGALFYPPVSQRLDWMVDVGKYFTDESMKGQKDIGSLQTMPASSNWPFSTPKWRSLKTFSRSLKWHTFKEVKIGNKTGVCETIYEYNPYNLLRLEQKTPKQKYLPHGNVMKPPPPIVL